MGNGLNLLLVLLLLVSVGAVEAQPTFTVGSKRFTESYILGEILRQTAEQVGEAPTVHRQGLGNTGVLFAALQSGGIDLYPEYTGTLSQELLHLNNPHPSLAELDHQLAPLGLGVGVPLGFDDTYALAMAEKQAEKLQIRTLSDLARHPELRLGLSQEFLQRRDGWPGVKARYRLPFTTPRGLDHGLVYEAIAAGQIDVTDIYSTDAKIARYKLRVLIDDQHYFPSYEAVLLYRREVPQRFPKTWRAFQQLQISAAKMVELNAQAELENQAFTQIAQGFLRGTPSPTTERSFLDLLIGPDFGRLTGEHLLLVLISLAGGILLGVPLGVWAERVTWVTQPLLALVGLIQTIPALALLAFLITLFRQIGTLPALVALFLYALLPIVRNTYTGLAAISPALRESALALGLPPWARLYLVELPLASPTVLAGIKTAAVINVGTATIAAFIGAGGYGERIASGLALNDNGVLLSGAIPAALLALAMQVFFEWLDRWLIPPGLRP